MLGTAIQPSRRLGWGMGIGKRLSADEKAAKEEEAVKAKEMEVAKKTEEAKAGGTDKATDKESVKPREDKGSKLDEKREVNSKKEDGVKAKREDLVKGKREETVKGKKEESLKATEEEIKAKEKAIKSNETVEIEEQRAKGREVRSAAVARVSGKEVRSAREKGEKPHMEGGKAKPGVVRAKEEVMKEKVDGGLVKEKLPGKEGRSVKSKATPEEALSVREVALAKGSTKEAVSAKEGSSAVDVGSMKGTVSENQKVSEHLEETGQKTKVSRSAEASSRKVISAKAGASSSDALPAKGKASAKNTVSAKEAVTLNEPFCGNQERTLKVKQAVSVNQEARSKKEETFPRREAVSSTAMVTSRAEKPSAGSTADNSDTAGSGAERGVVSAGRTSPVTREDSSLRIVSSTPRSPPMDDSVEAAIKIKGIVVTEGGVKEKGGGDGGGSARKEVTRGGSSSSVSVSPVSSVEPSVSPSVTVPHQDSRKRSCPGGVPSSGRAASPKLPSPRNSQQQLSVPTAGGTRRGITNGGNGSRGKRTGVNTSPKDLGSGSGKGTPESRDRVPGINNNCKKTMDLREDKHPMVPLVQKYESGEPGGVSGGVENLQKGE